MAIVGGSFLQRMEKKVCRRFWGGGEEEEEVSQRTPAKVRESADCPRAVRQKKLSLSETAGRPRGDFFLFSSLAGFLFLFFF